MNFGMSLSMCAKEAGRILKMLIKNITPYLILFSTDFFVSMCALFSVVQNPVKLILFSKPEKFYLESLKFTCTVLHSYSNSSSGNCVLTTFQAVCLEHIILLSSQQSYDMVSCWPLFIDNKIEA